MSTPKKKTAVKKPIVEDAGTPSRIEELEKEIILQEEIAKAQARLNGLDATIQAYGLAAVILDRLSLHSEREATQWLNQQD